MAKVVEGRLEKEWRSYIGTGTTAHKGRNAMALRESIGGGKYAVVMLYGGLWTTSPIKVLEEIATIDLKTARARFNALAKKLGFK